MDKSRIPVVVAGAQLTRKEGLYTSSQLLEEAALASLARGRNVASKITDVTVVGILSKHASAPATELALALGLKEEVKKSTTTIGGNTPQFLVNLYCRRIAEGEHVVALIAGAEAMRSQREIRMLKAQGQSPDLPRMREDLPPDPQIGDPRPGVSQEEMEAGLITPVQIYPLFENALGKEDSLDFQAQRERAAKIFERFTKVAARNPLAWFPQERSYLELATPGENNRLVAEPYTKLLCSFMGSDQAASFIVCSLQEAEAMGLDSEAMFAVAGSDLNDCWFFSTRPVFHRSPAMETLASALFSAVQREVDDLDAIDLYSCFPIAVELAAAAIGTDPVQGKELTVTGGLPYFGGPGNNYVSHSIATMQQTLAGSRKFALITGLGWYVTKHSWGIYSGSAPDRFVYVDLSEEQNKIDAQAVKVVPAAEDENGRILTHTVIYDDEGREVVAVPAVIELEGSSHRVVAACGETDLQAFRGRSVIGQKVRVSGKPPRWYLS